MSLRVCIYGAGAIGGFLAARLANAGIDVSCIARGAHLRAIRADGLRLIDGDLEIRVNIPCTDAPAKLGEQDVVFTTMKAHALSACIADIASILGPATTIVSAHNGLPWWYFYHDASGYPDQHLDTVDPDGRIWNTLGPDRAVGAVVYPAAEVVAPGIVKHLHGNRLTIGEPNGETSARVTAILDSLCAAGLQATVSGDIRSEVWLKLSINAAINLLSLDFEATIGRILTDAAAQEQLLTMIRESQQVALSLGIAPLRSAEELAAALLPFSEHKTSMLMDYEAGRPLELETITGAVLEIGARAQVATPVLRDLYDRLRRAR